MHSMARPVSSESVFRALAHPTRRRILELLARRPWPAGELVGEFKHSQSTLSRHLRTLNTAGLVTYRVRGSRHVYELVPGTLASLRRWVDQIPARPGPRAKGR